MTRKLKVGVAVGLAAILFFLGGTKVALARAFRNNNPGNIKFNPHNDWKGQVGQDDGGFVIFDTPEHGIRATSVIALNYKLRHGIRTLREFGQRWAPDSDNPGKETDHYAKGLSRQLGVGIDDDFDIEANILPLVKAITRNESSILYFPESTYAAGTTLALRNKGLA